MPPFPSAIRVGYRDYRVAEFTPSFDLPHDADGRHSQADGLIMVRVQGRDLQEQANTLLHEVMHAIYLIGAASGVDDEEKLVTIFANMLAQVWRDNPELVDWLDAALRPEKP